MANEKRLIDANALLAELDKFANPMPNKSGYDFLCGVASVITEIEDAPTVDAVEVVHAEWLDGYGVCDNKKSYISIDCSNCGEYFKLPSIDENIEEWKKRFAYCPFCGAKMDGGNGDV